MSGEQADRCRKRLDEFAQEASEGARTAAAAAEAFEKGADPEEALARLETLQDRADCGEALFEDLEAILEDAEEDTEEDTEGDDGEEDPESDND